MLLYLSRLLSEHNNTQTLLYHTSLYLKIEAIQFLASLECIISNAYWRQISGTCQKFTILKSITTYRFYIFATFHNGKIATFIKT